VARTTAYRSEKAFPPRTRRALEWAWLESPSSSRAITARVNTFDAYTFDQCPFNASIPAARPHVASTRVQTFNGFAFDQCTFDGSIPFSPRSISGIILWLDASQPTMLQNASTGSPPASGSITSGTLVGTWFDNSGNNTTTFSQGTTAYQPTYYSSGGAIPNDGPYVNFQPDSVSDGMDTNGKFLSERSAVLYAPLATDNTVMILLYKYSSVLDSVIDYFFTNITGVSTAEGLGRNDMGAFTRLVSTLAAPMSDSATHALVYTYKSGTTTENIYIDSSSAVASTTSAGRPAMTGNGFEIGDILYTANAQYYEVLVYNSVLANTDISKNLAYWNTKWGTTFNTAIVPFTPWIFGDQCCELQG